MTKEGLRKLFQPRSIAVIGATEEVGRVGTALWENLAHSALSVTVYPVNPNRKTVFGAASYPSILAIKEKIDLAVIATPAVTVPKIIDECAKAGTGSAIIISSGFKEGGESGEKLFTALTESVQKSRLTVLGPNCLGFLTPTLNASFIKQTPKPGRIAFISQSGALGSAVLDWAGKEQIGFSNFISVGETVDVDFSGLLTYLKKDPETDGILIYLESLTNAKEFLAAARSCSFNKPVVVLKGGRNENGARAAFSHTGSLAGDVAVYSAAFARSGIIQVRTIRDLFDVAKLLTKNVKGGRLAIVTNAGGPGVVATDYLSENRGQLAELSPETIAALEKVLGPSSWSRTNPVDVLGDAGPEKIIGSAEICLTDPKVDGVLVILTPQAMTEPLRVAEGLIDLNKNSTKPVLTTFLGGALVDPSKELLKQNQVPVFDFPEEAVGAFIFLANYFGSKPLLNEAPLPAGQKPRFDTAANKQIIEKVKREDRKLLNPEEISTFLSNYNIPVNKSITASSAEEAADAAQKIGFPVVLKIASADISHKTEAGGIILNVTSPEKVAIAFNEILSRAKVFSSGAEVSGVTVSRFEPRKFELFLGMKKDATFGPVLAFGRGGVEVEALKDIAVEPVPLDKRLARLMVERTQISKLLVGFRGTKGIDLEELVKLLCNFSRLAEDFPEVSEIDLNPLAADERGFLVLDARILLGRS